MEIRGLIITNSDSVARNGDVQLSAPSPGLIDVAGKSPLQRTAERMQKFGIWPVTAVIQEESSLAGAAQNGLSSLTCITAASDRFWRAAESAFNDLAQAGAELVIVVHLGAYAELDFEKLVQFHLDQRCRVSQVAFEGEPQGIFCVSASRRNDAASLFRSQLTRCRTDCPHFEHTGYLNPLTDAHDLRQLAIDILTLCTETAPAGTQLKPGVWVVPGARIEKGARLLAPAFVGAGARVRSGSVVTRCSSIERYSQVDCGTILENSTVLPYCYVGAGLELAHSVAGFGHIANLRRACIVPITDQKLLRHIAATSGNRLLASAAELVAYVPRQFWRGITAQRRINQPDLQTSLHQTSPALGKASGYESPACDPEAANQFPSNLAVARTHGNQ